MNTNYLAFINEIKENIFKSRYIATRLANREQLLLYLQIGKILSEKLLTEKWGTNVIEQVSMDLQSQVPGLKGFSYRNMRNMRQFYEANSTIWQSLTAKLHTKLKINELNANASSAASIFTNFFGISFTHHVLLLNKCKNEEERFFYINLSAREFWSVSVLDYKVGSKLFEKQGKLPNNFSNTLPSKLKPAALQVFKDEYLLDFMELDDTADERMVEGEIVANIKDFIIRMGKGFCFIGNQYKVELDGEEFFIDLLFFNRYLSCLVAFELKRGKFKPEYAGQLNFYLNVLDEKVRLSHENSSIGIVLCKEKNNTVVEFSIKSIKKGMAVATYTTTQKPPKEIKDILPSTEELVKLL